MDISFDVRVTISEEDERILVEISELSMESTSEKPLMVLFRLACKIE
jgi:hypothetical protein